MKFISTASALALLSTSAYAAVSADQMVANIDAITDLSSQTNDVARSISVVNFFSTAPQLINNFRQIITIVTNDISAMNSKSRKTKRQECLDAEDFEKCIADLGEIIEDPFEILGDKMKRGGPSARRQATTTYTPTEQEAICGSFRSFVQVHQSLLTTVIGKHGLLSLTPFTQPIAQVLRVLEGGVDTIAFDIIDSVPTCAQSTTQNKNSLDQTLDQAIDTYSP